MHQCICIFCGEHAWIFYRCCEYHACTGVYVRQVLCTSAYTFAYTLATGRAYALMYVRFVHLALRNEDGWVQLVYESTCCLAWGVIFDRRKDRGVVCVLSIFNAGESVCGCMCVNTHTHPQYTDGVLGFEPRSRNETPGEMESSRSTKVQYICRPYRCTKYICLYMC